jgi:hypothetical protein
VIESCIEGMNAREKKRLKSVTVAIFLRDLSAPIFIYIYMVVVLVLFSVHSDQV